MESQAKLLSVLDAEGLLAKFLYRTRKGLIGLLEQVKKGVLCTKAQS
jgi:hypothetical protein